MMRTALIPRLRAIAPVRQVRAFTSYNAPVAGLTEAQEEVRSVARTD